MAERIDQISIQTQRRIARARGPTSSASYNDTIEEISHDISEISSQWNSRLVPLMAFLPDGRADNDINAFTDGLSGTTMYVEDDATSIYRSSYYNTVSTRPNTIYEQFVDVYTQVTDLQTDLEEQIEDFTTVATSIAITDTASIYTAINVEAALAEVMAKVNVVAISGVDLSAVAQHFIPAVDNTYDIGSNVKGIRSIYSQLLTINGDSIRIATSQSPASNGTGTQGEIAWDADYIYVCTATDTWERAALTGGY